MTNSATSTAREPAGGGERLGDIIFGVDEETMEDAIARRLLVEPHGDMHVTLIGELDAVADSIRRGRDPEPDGREGLRDLVTMQAIYRAAREGGWIPIDFPEESV